MEEPGIYCTPDKGTKAPHSTFSVGIEFLVKIFQSSKETVSGLRTILATMREGMVNLIN